MRLPAEATESTMSREDKVIYLEKSRVGSRGAIQEVFDRVRQLAVQRLGQLLGQAMDQVDDALFERAEKAENSQVQTSYFDAMRLLRLRRKEVEEAFQRELIAHFRQLLSGGRSSGDKLLDEDADLTLVDNEVLEQSIAVETMTAKARTRNTQPLSHLLMRLDHLLSSAEVSENNNPLDPMQIVEAFARVCEPLQIEIGPRLVLYKLFDKQVMGALGPFYEEVNALLIEVGVLPELKRPTPKRPAPGRRPAGSAAEADDGSEDSVFQALHELLSQQKYGGGAGGATGGFGGGGGGGYGSGAGYGGGWGGAGEAAGPPAALPDLIAALSTLQRHEDAPGGELHDADLKQLLVQALSARGGKPRGVGRAEDDTIDIVGMLFDAILDDPQLPSCLKALIARLQIPVLKVALLDRSFFSMKKHPARQLINEMAQAALGWVEPAHPERDPLYRQVDSIVDRVLNEFGDNVDLFQDVLEQFLVFLEEERERARLIEERTRQAAEGKAKVDGAKERVDQEIHERVQNRRIPDVVDTLLREAWAKVLFITYLKDGGQGEVWERQLALVDRLVWSVQPKADAAERKQLLVEIPGLLHDLREGLNAILFNPFEMTKLFKALEAEHVRCLSSVGARPAAPANPTAEAAEVTPAVAEPAEPEDLASRAAAEPGVDAELQEYLDRLQNVAVGTWFEFPQGNNSRVRAKLSARLAGGRRLIFVNRAGFKMADKRLEELAADLRSGTVQILDDNLLFDKALETVVANLRDLRAGR